MGLWHGMKSAGLPQQGISGLVGGVAFSGVGLLGLKRQSLVSGFLLMILAEKSLQVGFESPQRQWS